MAKSKKRRKRQRVGKGTVKSGMNRLKKNTKRQAREMGDKVKFIETKLKMSEVLIDFIEPYKDDVETIDQFESLIGIATLAWNAAFLSPGSQLDAAQQLAETVPDDVKASVPELFTELLKRKQRHFSHITRMIMQYEVTDTGNDDWHVAVSSLLMEEEIEQSGLV